MDVGPHVHLRLGTLSTLSTKASLVEGCDAVRIDSAQRSLQTWVARQDNSVLWTR
jgi:hypothetical protein